MEDVEIIKALVDTGWWGETDAAMGLEAGFKCQYCGKDLLRSVDSYKEWQTDHLIPASAGGVNAIYNYVVCCRTCNFIKGKWNPLQDVTDENSTRGALLEAARGYISRKRAMGLELVEEFRGIVSSG